MAKLNFFCQRHPNVAKPNESMKKKYNGTPHRTDKEIKSIFTTDFYTILFFCLLNRGKSK